MFKSEELNAALALSKSQVYRKLKGISGLAPNKLINEYRLRKALEKIAQKEHTIAEIAFDHGFSSPTYFTRVFSKRFGINPTKYAKSKNKILF